MQFTSSVRETFGASHNTSICGHGVHGHDFTLEVAISGEPGKEGHLLVYAELLARLRTLVDEFRGRDLDDMLIPAIPEQLCIYVRERLSLWVPGITCVRVSTRELTASVEFPIR